MVSHKNVDYIPKDRTPIFVGNGDNVKNYLRDNTGDNISSKNPNYCELTAFYWIWKNDKKSDYVSIEHYRRFFMSPLIKPISIFKVEKLLKKYDVIESENITFKTSLKDYYKNKHYESDLDVVEAAITKLSPEYLPSYYKIINGNKACMCNMIIMSKENFDNYCEWLFSILNYVEKNIDINNRSDYQKRVFGFISERLQNVWVDYKKVKVKILPIYYIKDNIIMSKLKSIKHLLMK
jgi:hypothetical protein